MKLVFAYGSLINRKEIERTLEIKDAEKDYVVLGRGRLNNYRLAFTRFSEKKWKGGVLDVITSKDDYVLGLVLEVSNKALMKIEKREGVAKGDYKPKTVSVELWGEVVEANVYTVVNKDLSGIKASEKYVNIVEAGMREKGFPEGYINKYLLGKISEKTVLNTLRYIRTQPHATELSKIANMPGVKRQDIPLLVDCLINRGYIRKDKGDSFDKYDLAAKYFTVREKRQEIDRMLEEDQL